MSRYHPALLVWLLWSCCPITFDDSRGSGGRTDAPRSALGTDVLANAETLLLSSKTLWQFRESSLCLHTTLTPPHHGQDLSHCHHSVPEPLTARPRCWDLQHIQAGKPGSTLPWATHTHNRLQKLVSLPSSGPCSFVLLSSSCSHVQPAVSKVEDLQMMHLGKRVTFKHKSNPWKQHLMKLRKPKMLHGLAFCSSFLLL